MAGSTYTFLDPDLRHAVCLWLNVHGFPYTEICGNSIQVKFPSVADRETFESLVVCSAQSPELVRYLDHGAWQSLPRRPYVDRGGG